ncbi:MAG: aminotransferase class III-fold pyridoxal phosphate-dependent enzyme, partial [Bacteroidota bacterium]
FAPYDGTVEIIVNDEGDKEYGPLLVLKHITDGDLSFYTLYGHLSTDTLSKWNKGDEIKKGSIIAHIGDFPENGNWVPHVHFQIITEILDYLDDYPGVAAPEELAVWKSLCPNPNLILQMEHPDLIFKETKIKDLLLDRASMMPGNLSVNYAKDPLKIVRGYKQYLYDAKGRVYLDLANNVAHVGHQHPRVVNAAIKQMAVLNTNTRYLHDNIVDFTKAILETMPDSLSVVYCVNSGSEANELAMRLATTYTKAKDIIALEVGYHGNSQACVDVSSYKFDSNGGEGKKDHIHIIPLPDSFRGKFRGSEAGSMYAKAMQEVVDKIDKKPAAFIAESIMSCGGQVVLPKGFLEKAYEITRAKGGVCIADEVQTGVGRTGKHFWAFQLHDVVPDIVTIGKPIGNGHPLAVVITTKAIAEAFHNGMEWFNTFGGNPVSMAIGKEVLDIVKDEKLQENALAVGNYFKSKLRALAEAFPIIADVRGEGLFIGFELIRNKETMEPADLETSHLALRMRQHRILLGTDGKDHNVIKIKPPMCFTKANVDHVIDTLKKVLKEDFFN